MLRTWDLSVEDTYLQRTTQVGDAEVFAHADFSPDGQQVAYSWLDGGHGMGQVRRHRHRRSDAARARAGVRGPLGQRHLASPGSRSTSRTRTAAQPSAARGDRRRGPRPRHRQGPRETGALSTATSPRSRTSTGTAACSWATANGRTHLLDAESLLPEGDGFEFAAHVSTPIGDGSTAMVHAISGDGTSVHWRVIDVSTGDVLSEGDLDLRRERLGCLSGRLDGRGGGEHRRDRRPSTSRPETNSGDPPASVPRCSGSTTPTTESCWSPAPTDGGVSLWDATTLDLLGTVYPPHHGDPVPAGAQFIGDSHDVAIASYDGKVYRWETDLDRAIDFACQMAGRNLTDEEWEEFLPAQPYQSVCPDE